MDDKKNSSPTLKERLRALTSEVALGRTHLAIAKRLRVAPKAVLHKAPTFFNLTHNAHLDAAYLCAAKLYDKQKKATTVRKTLDEAERTAGTFGKSSAENVRTIVAAARKEIERFEKTIDALGDRRNEYIAHLGPEKITDPKALGKAPALTFDELDELLVGTGNILNDISQAYDGTLAVPALPHSDDCEEVLRLVAEGDRKR